MQGREEILLGAVIPRIQRRDEIERAELASRHGSLFLAVARFGRVPLTGALVPELERLGLQDEAVGVGAAVELLEAGDLLLAEEEMQAVGQVRTHLRGVQAELG